MPVLADDTAEETETFSVTVSVPTNAGLADATAPGTIINRAGTVPPELSLELSSLQVTGGGTMYPKFAPDIHHYALTCKNSATLHVRAQARRTSAGPTLLRADENQNVVAATDMLNASVTGQGFSDFGGGVDVLDNGHWVIARGRPGGHPVGEQELISISEVDPATGTSMFEMNLSKAPYMGATYRVYREPEANINIPLNLP